MGSNLADTADTLLSSPGSTAGRQCLEAGYRPDPDSEMVCIPQVKVAEFRQPGGDFL